MLLEHVWIAVICWSFDRRHLLACQAKSDGPHQRLGEDMIPRFTFWWCWTMGLIHHNFNRPLAPPNNQPNRPNRPNRPTLLPTPPPPLPTMRSFAVFMLLALSVSTCCALTPSSPLVQLQTQTQVQQQAQPHVETPGMQFKHAHVNTCAHRTRTAPHLS